MIRRVRPSNKPAVATGGAVGACHAIGEDFERLMARHSELNRKGFNNLRQGLGIALLVAEQPASGLSTDIHEIYLCVNVRRTYWEEQRSVDR